ncbi:MAG: ParB N-terminal domain-containing protein, partial [Planctomycetota bacterium]
MKTEMMEVGKLVKDPRNARTHDDRNIGTIMHSLKTFGQQKPIVIGADDVVMAGNGTLEAAIQLGLDRVPVHVAAELTPAQAKAYRIADNKTNELADWNFELLPIELSELKALDIDLNSLGFDDDDLAKIFAGDVTGGLCDPDDIPEPPDEAITQRGDLWLLGQHRLLCGDSACPKDVDQLLAGAPIHLVNTDPPYNVKVEPR